MKYCLPVVLGLFLCGTVAAQDHSAHTQAKPATLMQGYGDLHHPVSTNNAQAQQFFDQGFRQIYAFNHDEAARSFQRAADLDPKVAMAYWGVAEAVGPNYNDPASDDRFATAHTAIQKAVDLSGSASPAEQAYIKAMALRFPADPKADRRQAAEAYHDAMREVVKQFPDDLDAATLFAESGMNLHPWGLWMVDGTPREGTTFTPWRPRSLRSVPWPGPTGWLLWRQRRDTSSTCRLTSTYAPAITRPLSKPTRKRRQSMRPTSRRVVRRASTP